MEKVCIFCGKKPENKNKEHIFPQWLIKMTGFDKINASVGSNWKTGKEIVINTLSYTFPSCSKCNDKFSILEGKVKFIIERLSKDEDVKGEELELLLDWFDKVRIGAWLGVKYMNKEVITLTPKYYINNRVRLKDRFLSITNTYKEEKILNWSGVNTLAFMLSPTAFTLRVNNLVFVNCSSDFIMSKSLGFPFSKEEIINPYSKETLFKMAYGTRKAKSDIFKTKLYKPAIIIAQPIYKVSENKLDKLYNNDYIRENSYENGIGKIFISNKKNMKAINRDEYINFGMPEAKEEFPYIEVVRPILELQIELIKNRKTNLKFLSEEEKKKFVENRNNVILYTKKQIRQFNY